MCMWYIVGYSYKVLLYFSDFISGVFWWNSHPFIVRLYDGDKTITPVYSVMVEEVTIKCRDFLTALYSVLTIHYIFNISNWMIYSCSFKKLFTRYLKKQLKSQPTFWTFVLPLKQLSRWSMNCDMNHITLWI